jgi:Cu+-exporting ATPase
VSNTTYTVQGMTCGGCATKVAKALIDVSGVTDATVDLSSGTVTVAGENVNDQAVRNAIVDAGYQLA